MFSLRDYFAQAFPLANQKALLDGALAFIQANPFTSIRVYASSIK